MRHALLLFALLVVLVPESVAAGPAPQSCAPLAEGEGLTLTGPASMNSQPFSLAAGSYVVRWTATRGTAPLGNVILRVARVDGGYFSGSGTLVNLVLGTGETELSGETYLYGVKPGLHYLDVKSPGPWSVTLAPLG